MDARAYLARIEENRIKIVNKQIEKRYWLDMAGSTAAKVGGERVQSSGDNHSMENKVVEAVMCDKEIDRLKKEIEDIIRTIEMLTPPEYDILHKVHVQNRQMKVIAAEEKKSYSSVTTMHSRAVKSLQALLDV